MKNFRDLDVWNRSHKMILDAYVVTRPFPREEMYGLTSQIRRSAGSIGANIAEGCGRGSDADFGRFLQMAMGSASELENHLLVAHDLGYLMSEKFKEFEFEVIGIKRMLVGLIKRTR